MTGQDIAKQAKIYVGTPYVWGGEDPEKEGGLDCSGLYCRILCDLGYPHYRMTAQGYSTICDPVKDSEKQPGDALFFGKSTATITHMAIYYGGGYMIQSSGGRKNTKSNPGKGVNMALVRTRSDLVKIGRLKLLNSQNIGYYEVGSEYTVAYDHLHVREQPGTASAIVPYSKLTKDGQKHAFSDGCLKKGTSVTCLEISDKIQGETWIRIPSKWICACDKNKRYVI